DGMYECQQTCMQRLAAKRLQRRLRLETQVTRARFEARTVGCVAEQGVTDVGEMHADLVRTPCLELELEQAGDGLRLRAAVLLEHVVARARAPAGIRADDGDLGAVGAAAGQRRFNRPVRPLRRAPHDRPV